MENKKLKMCFLTVGLYPVPATEGGAVENLTEIMAENYQTGDFDFSFDIISKYTESAYKKSLEYDKTGFYFIKYSQIHSKICRYIRSIIRKISGKSYNEIDPYLSKAIKAIRKNKYDVVVIENPVFFVDAIKRKCGCTTVLHLHNDYFDLSTQSADKVVGGADLIISVSDFVKDRLKYKGGVDIKSVTVKNVIDTERFKKSDKNIKKAKEIRRKFGFKDDDTLCLFVGRLVPEKGIGLLIDAMEKTYNEKIKLLIAGGSAFADSKKTDFERSLYEAAGKLGERIKFAGYVDNKVIAPYYHACDIAVFPSQCDEAAGLVLLEAQAAEKPLIIANSGGMGEYVCQQSAVIIEKGDNFTDRLAEEITKLSNNKEKQCEMAKAGYEFSLNYNKENYLKNIAEAIKIVTDKQK